MKKSVFTCCIILLLFISAQAQWEQTNGPCNVNVRSFFTSPGNAGVTNIFACTDHGLLLSTNSGKNWKLINIGTENNDVYAMVKIGNSIFAGAYGGVFRSTDNGITWTDVSQGLNSHYSAAIALAQYPDGKGGAYLFTSINSYGVFLSKDNGSTWIKMDSGFTGSSRCINSFITTTYGTSGTNLFAGTEGNDAVYVTQNNGTSWTPVITGLPYSSYDYSLTSNSNGDLFTGTHNGVYRSTNNGANWSKVLSGELSNTAFTALAFCPNGTGETNLFAGTDGGKIYRSANNGNSWTEINNGLTCTGVKAFTAITDGTGKVNIMAGTNNGIYLSANNGEKWEAINTGISNVKVTSLTSVSNGNLFAASSDNGFYLTNNNGASWKSINTGLTTKNVSAITVCPNGNLIAGTYAGTFLSTDNASNWVADQTGLTYKYINCLLMNGTNIFAGTSGNGLYVSANNGQSWAWVAGAPKAAISTLLASSDGKGGSNLYAGTIYAGLYRSVNNGIDWTPVGTSNWAAVVYSVAVCDTSIFVATPGNGVLFISKHATDWTKVNNGLTSKNVHSLLAIDNNIFAGTDDGIFSTTDNGLNWKPVNTGLPPNTPVLSITASSAFLYAATESSGVWRRPLIDIVTGIGSSKNNLSKSTQLQNYPNPFNSITTIKYQITESGFVSLKVYDAMGAEVASLVNEKKTAGEYSIDWNAAGLRNGIYLCKLQNGSKCEIKKMMLLK
jgi:ligand-binding sensor domain-containing protein